MTSDDNQAQQDEQRKDERVNIQSHQLSLEKMRDYNETLHRRGVVYIARIPPKLTPTKLKQLLQEFEVTRIFLVPEDAAVRKRRRKLTGNGSKRYVEGWLEFADKHVAKTVAVQLNNTRMEQKKRATHYDDLWSLKYLPKFKWAHLTEKVAYEKRVQAQKIKLETLQARKETQAYKKLVETGQKVDRIAQRKRKRGEEPETKKMHHQSQQVAPVDPEQQRSTKSAIVQSLI